MGVPADPPAAEPALSDPAGHTRAAFGRSALSRLPEARTILSCVYIVRMAVVLAAFVAVLWRWTVMDPVVTRTVVLLLLLAGVVTAAGAWHTHLLRRDPGRTFLYGQSVFDALLVTMIVHLTGGAQSAFAPLYILVIWAGAILLPFVGGLLVAMLVSVLYVAAVVWTSPGELQGGVFLQLALFSAVAVLTGYLGDRLRQTGTALGEVNTQLALLRLDTDEILKSINTGILTVDGDGRLVFMNRAAAELLSLSEADHVGRPVLELLNRAAPGLGRVIDLSQRERRPIARFETDAGEDGTFVLGVSTTLVERDQSGLPAVTAIFQNITEKVRMEQLHRRAERLESLAELSASLAHEIRNPLASIRSAVEQLVHPGIDPADRAVLNQLVTRESTRLSRLLGEFLDFARVKVTRPSMVELRAVVENVLTLVRQHPEAAGREIRLEVREDGPVTVQGAEDLLHRAVLNLVLNAVQWAGDGGRVWIALDLVDSDLLSPVGGARRMARLRVGDSGPGIDPDASEHIFDPFFTRRPGGAGLGLALVQRAAEAHGGVVYVDEARPFHPSGAVLTLCLPTLAVEDVVAAPSAPAEVPR